jgi:hypothetical protein
VSSHLVAPTDEVVVPPRERRREVVPQENVQRHVPPGRQARRGHFVHPGRNLDRKVLVGGVPVKIPGGQKKFFKKIKILKKKDFEVRKKKKKKKNGLHVLHLFNALSVLADEDGRNYHNGDGIYIKKTGIGGKAQSQKEGRKKSQTVGVGARKYLSRTS